jgi:hypothetical protein
MNMAIVKINPLTDGRWMEFITHNKSANIFHHPAWLRVLNKQYNYPVAALCLLSSGNEISAGMPFCEVSGISQRKKLVSLPFSDYCNPLYCTEQQMYEFSRLLMDEYCGRKSAPMEIFWGMPPEMGFNVTSTHVYHVTELVKDEKALMKSFNRTKSQGIAKSIKQGLNVDFSTDYNAIEIFYRLHLKTRKKLGVPIQPKRFFYHIYEEIIKNGLGFIVIISKDNVEMAAGLFMGFNETLTYKYNASDPDYLEFRPNNLIIWAAMQEGIRKDFKYFDFGKSDIDNEGLRSFKDGWAAVEKPLYYSYVPLPADGASFSFIKDKLIAPVIKSSPDFVCKLIGEVAYKYFPSI